MDGPFATGGRCSHPHCYNRLPSAAGHPCNQQACPNCGTDMIRIHLRRQWSIVISGGDKTGSGKLAELPEAQAEAPGRKVGS